MPIVQVDYPFQEDDLPNIHPRPAVNDDDDNSTDGDSDFAYLGELELAPL